MKLYSEKLLEVDKKVLIYTRNFQFLKTEMFKVHKNLSVAITRNLLSSDLSIVFPTETTGTNAYLGLKDWNIISIEVKDLLQERKFQNFIK